MQSLIALLQHTEAERDRTLAACQAASAAHLSAQSQYDQLLDYRREYEARWNGQFSQQGQIELVRCYHGFMLRLTQAVEHQQAVVQGAQTRLASARAALRERETRVAAVRKLIERRSVRERGELARREQKLSDEMASHAVRDSTIHGGLASTF
jgi:flagellar FliJ protein